MAEIVGVGCGSCTDRGPEAGDCTCTDCVTGGQQCLPNNPKNRTSQQIANMGTRRRYSGFEGSGQTPLNVQPQWSNDGTRNQVFVGMDGSSEGYGSIFSQKNYWIGVVAGVVGLMAYQKYVK